MKKATSIITVFIVIALIYTFMPSLSTKELVPYSEFYSLAEKGEITSVELKKDTIIYTTKEGKINTTLNPQSQDLRERLLLKDIEVKTENKDLEERLTFIFDTIFNLLFFGMIIGGCLYFFTLPGRKFKVVKKTTTTFKDVAGLEDTKKDMMELVKILKNPKAYAEKGVRQPSGVLFVGAPGNGKTLMAKALAGEANMNFIATKATDFQSSFMAVGPAKVKSLFNRARKHAPCIIFIDEFDGIGEKRNYAGMAIDKENNRIITSLLNELDGFTGHASGVMVVGATNNIQDLDPALIRPGRFDRKYLIPNPDEKARFELIELYRKNYEIDNSITINRLVMMTKNLSSAAIESLLNEAILIVSADNRKTITLEDIKKASKRCALMLSN